MAHKLTKPYSPKPSPNSGYLPKPTIRLLACVAYLVDPNLPAVKQLLGFAALHIHGDALLSLSLERWGYLCGRDITWVRRTLRLAEKLGYLKRLSGGRGRGNTTQYHVELMAHYAEAEARMQAWQPGLKDGGLPAYQMTHPRKRCVKGGMVPPFRPFPPVKGGKLPSFRGVKGGNPPVKGGSLPPDPDLDPKELDPPRTYPTAEETRRYLNKVFGGD